MKQIKWLYNERTWLNSDKSYDVGAVQSQVYIDYLIGGVTGRLVFWDCSRKIELDFSFDQEKDALDRAAKLDKIIRVLENMKDALASAYDEIESGAVKEEQERYFDTINEEEDDY